MTNKAYIVANEQQEREVLGILGANGLKYVIGTYSQFRPLTGFPYVIYESNNSNVLKSGRVPKLNIYLTDVMYDGRKEDKMSKKYVVSQEFMDKLEEWRCVEGFFVVTIEISTLPDVVKHWWCNGNNKENNNRLIAILRWVNGEDVFEVEKPKKWVVRSKECDEDGDYHYVNLDNFKNLKSVSTIYAFDCATKFDAKEEAESWANAHQEVVQVEM
ncbi:hypothetical protein [Weissella fangxianensis]|uniref:hypothetical protein n=1 Tax=Weissella fangxianensis TaxID=2953879 RepID=UPI00215793F1|nr:hypothetical protein [Weissella fangxianensis]